MPVDESLEKITARAEDLVEADRKFLKDLISYRERHYLTQADVAERMGVSQSTVSSFERYDANPTMATIRRYALAVGVKMRTTFIDDCGPVEGTSMRGFMRPEATSADWTTLDAVEWTWGTSVKSVKNVKSAHRYTNA